MQYTNNLKSVRTERTGWRDNKLDDLLNKEGLDPPQSFLVTEYNYGKSVAIIEYKSIGSSTIPDKRLINYCKLRNNKEYYFIILFDFINKDDKYKITEFQIYPGNENSSKFLMKNYSSSNPNLTEKEFIKFLYLIRDNCSSEYYKKAMEDYEEWFKMDMRKPTYHNIISNRHRDYAYDVPAADIDSFICDKEDNPYLFIEYKANHNYGKVIDDGHNHFIFSNIDFKTNALSNKGKKKLWNQALNDLGDGCKQPLPVIAVEYNLENNVFSIYALNETAKKTVTLKTMSQEEYFKYIKEPKNFKKEQCPLCGRPLEIKNGRYGKFYSCTGFKIGKCRYSRNI